MKISQVAHLQIRELNKTSDLRAEEVSRQSQKERNIDSLEKTLMKETLKKVQC